MLCTSVGNCIPVMAGDLVGVWCYAIGTQHHTKELEGRHPEAALGGIRRNARLLQYLDGNLESAVGFRPASAIHQDVAYHVDTSFN